MLEEQGMEEHIPGAQFFSIADIVEKNHSNFLAIPKLEDFNKYVHQLNIRKSDKIICYDNFGIGTSPRIWWTFKHLGAQNVFVLNGGLPKWKALDLPIEHGDEKIC